MSDRDFDVSSVMVPSAVWERYTQIRYVDHGGMGAVFRAFDPQLRRHVALKLVRSDCSENNTLRERMRRECDVLSRVSHPNIVRLFDYIEDNGVACLVMEFVSGVTLASLIDEELVTVKQAVEIVAAIAEAMSEVHKVGVYHRDVKPSNIIITDDGVPKLLDFGAVTRLRSGRSAFKTAANLAVGTPPYMAPEILLGEKWDEKADVFQLGVVLYEALTGERPYDARSVESVAALAYGTKGKNIIAPKKLRAGVDKELNDLVMSCLSLSTKDRIGRVSEISRRCKRWMKGGKKQRLPKTNSFAEGPVLSRRSSSSLSLTLLLLLSTIVLQGFRYSQSLNECSIWTESLQTSASFDCVTINQKGTSGGIVECHIIESSTKRLVARKGGTLPMTVSSLKPATDYVARVTYSGKDVELGFSTKTLKPIKGAFACALNGRLYVDIETNLTGTLELRVTDNQKLWERAQRFKGTNRPIVIGGLPKISAGSYHWSISYQGEKLFTGIVSKRPEPLPSLRERWRLDGCDLDCSPWAMAPPLWIDDKLIVADATGAVTCFSFDRHPQSGDSTSTLSTLWSFIPPNQCKKSQGRAIGGLTDIGEGRLFFMTQGENNISAWCLDVEARRIQWLRNRDERSEKLLSPKEWCKTFDKMSFCPQGQGLLKNGRVYVQGGVRYPRLLQFDILKGQLLNERRCLSGMQIEERFCNHTKQGLLAGPPAIPYADRRWWFSSQMTNFDNKVSFLVNLGNANDLEYSAVLVSVHEKLEENFERSLFKTHAPGQRIVIDKNEKLWICGNKTLLQFSKENLKTPRVYNWEDVDKTGAVGYPVAAPIPSANNMALLRYTYTGPTSHSMLDHAAPKRVHLLDWQPGQQAKVNKQSIFTSVSPSLVREASLTGFCQDDDHFIGWGYHEIFAVSKNSNKAGGFVDGTSSFVAFSKGPSGWITIMTFLGEIYVLPVDFIAESSIVEKI